ncbi:MAG: N-acetylmuramoyl-L-alanine amidase [Chloroflexi bacterium]|nr:N-acetylmuramoyl-L-alanine amidase [Chloroflexota bacterium]
MKERKISLDIAERTKTKLETLGIEVSLTRTAEEPNLPLSTAAERVNAFSPDFVVSIHANAGGGTGTEACHTVGKVNSQDSEGRTSPK